MRLIFKLKENKIKSIIVKPIDPIYFEIKVDLFF